jgi:hypothetical protein
VNLHTGIGEKSIPVLGFLDFQPMFETNYGFDLIVVE